jgi:hypothetical protein
MSETVERRRRWDDGEVGASAERVLVVFNERDAIEEMEEDGVCVLREGGGGVENVSAPRSGSNGEMDGDGEGVWAFIAFIGNIKARGVGEMTLSIGVVVVSGPATATSRAWVKEGKGKRNGRYEARSRLGEYSQCAEVSRVRIAGMMMWLLSVSLFLGLHAREAEGAR